MGLANQRESAGWLQQGFKTHGISAEIAADKFKQADIHVVQGPHYALNEWLGQDNVIFLNRCFWGDSRFDLSIGWLLPDGSRDFCNADKTEANGTLPDMKPLKEKQRCAVVFGDYGIDASEMVTAARQEYDSVFFRPHPAQRQADSPVMTLRCDLEGVWEIADVAIGGSSTVLVQAVFEGLKVEAHDPLHVVHGATDRQAWATKLSWANWHMETICNGDFWDHLCCN